MVDNVEIEMDVEEAAANACSLLLPEKSKERYKLIYSKFKEWQDMKHLNIVDEKALLAYFFERSQHLKSPASLWSEYSMLKTTLSINDSIDISKFLKLRAFLKRGNDGYKPKKSNILSRQEIKTFLEEAPDSQYLLMKVVALVGVAGACRKEELLKMTLSDIEDKRDVIIIHIPDSKNKTKRTFRIINDTENNIDCLGIFRKYVNLRPKNADHRHLFLRYEVGKCANQVAGKNTLGKVPYNIAKYLNLDNPESYTGHSFRRTSATLLADTGADVLALKRHGGWRSSTVAESYVADSRANKLDIARRILCCTGEVRSESTMPSTSSSMIVEDSVSSKTTFSNSLSSSLIQESVPGLNVNNCTNVSFTFNITK